MDLFSSFALLAFFGFLVSAQKDNGEECSCFRTNGTSAAYFTSHRFFDYRDIQGNSAAVPAVVSSEADTVNAAATSDYLASAAFTADWAIQNWNNSDQLGTSDSDASVLLINSQNNVYIESSTDNATDYSTFLTLRTSRLPAFQSAAEIDSTALNFHYLSARFLARVVGSPGACAGMFTYLPNNDPQKVQEADIEILTSGPRNVVQYTNQPSTDKGGKVLPQATVNGTNPGAIDWTKWMVYRVDWMPKMTTWYVNGESVARIAFQAPRDPAGLIVNMWSDGGSWTGNMTVYDEAYLHIQWIEMAYNTSGPVNGVEKKRAEFESASLLDKRRGNAGCKAVCGVDEQVTVTGTPALLYNNTSTAPLGWKGEGMGSIVWLPIVLAGAALFGWI